MAVTLGIVIVLDRSRSQQGAQGRHSRHYCVIPKKLSQLRETILQPIKLT